MLITVWNELFTLNVNQVLHCQPEMLIGHFNYSALYSCMCAKELKTPKLALKTKECQTINMIIIY